MEIGPYRVTGRLGRGGFATVFRARSPDGRDVAIKLLGHPSTEARDRFAREARLLARLATDGGFVPLLDQGQSSGGDYVVLPLLEGGTLRDRLARGALPVDEAVRLVAHLARALGRAHALGIVHRDVKPENVLFDREGRAFVSDLGLARRFGGALSVTGGPLTATGSGLGTIGYEAPEQLDDAAHAGPPADVFALGVVLYECLAGEAPFDRSGVLKYVDAVRRGRATPLAALRPEVPAPLAALVSRALASDPRARPSDGTIFAEELEAASAATAPRRGSAARIAAVASIALVIGGGAILAPRLLRRQEPRPRDPVRERALEAVGAYSAGRFAEAAAIASEVLAKDPRCGVAWSVQARLVMRATTTDPTRVFEAAALAKRATDADPEIVTAWLIQAQASANRDDLDTALVQATRAVEAEPRSADAWAVRARIHERRGGRENWLHAVADATRAILLAPGDLEAWGMRALARNALRDLEGAARDLEVACRLDPSDPAPRLLLGKVRCQLEDYRGAATDAGRVLDGTKDPDAFVLRGVAREGLGLHEEAIEDLRSSLPAVPPDWFASIGYASLAQAQLMLGNAREAIVTAMTAVQIDAGNERAYQVRARALLQLGYHREAFADAQRALARDPDDRLALVVRAAARAIPDPEAARADALRVIADPRDVGPETLAQLRALVARIERGEPIPVPRPPGPPPPGLLDDEGDGRPPRPRFPPLQPPR